jgi:hypothetical protein
MKQDKRIGNTLVRIENILSGMSEMLKGIYHSVPDVPATQEQIDTILRLQASCGGILETKTNKNNIYTYRQADKDIKSLIIANRRRNDCSEE